VSIYLNNGLRPSSAYTAVVRLRTTTAFLVVYVIESRSIQPFSPRLQVYHWACVLIKLNQIKFISGNVSHEVKTLQSTPKRTKEEWQTLKRCFENCSELILYHFANLSHDNAYGRDFYRTHWYWCN